MLDTTQTAIDHRGLGSRPCYRFSRNAGANDAVRSRAGQCRFHGRAALLQNLVHAHLSGSKRQRSRS